MMRYARTALLGMAALGFPALAAAQDGKVMVATYIDDNAQTFGDIAQAGGADGPDNSEAFDLVDVVHIL